MQRHSCYIDKRTKPVKSDIDICYMRTCTKILKEYARKVKGFHVVYSLALGLDYAI